MQIRENNSDGLDHEHIGKITAAFDSSHFVSSINHTFPVNRQILVRTNNCEKMSMLLLPSGLL